MGDHFEIPRGQLVDLIPTLTAVVIPFAHSIITTQQVRRLSMQDICSIYRELCSSGNFDAMRWFNYRYPMRYTDSNLIELAIRKGHFPMVSLLVGTVSPPFILVNGRISMLCAALEGHSINIANYLIDEFEITRSEVTEYAFFVVYSSNNPFLLKWFLEKIKYKAVKYSGPAIMRGLVHQEELLQWFILEYEPPKELILCGYFTTKSVIHTIVTENKLSMLKWVVAHYRLTFKEIEESISLRNRRSATLFCAHPRIVLWATQHFGSEVANNYYNYVLEKTGMAKKNKQFLL
jgi:hypothetical protein